MSYTNYYSAAFELRSVRDSMLSFTESNDILRAQYEGLRKSLACFVVKSDQDLNNIPTERDNRFAYVLHNMLIRGIPTLASFDLEEEFRLAYPDIEFKELSTGSLEHKLVSNSAINESLLKALHIIEPRIDRETAYENYLVSWESHGSEYEERYLYEELPKRTFEGGGDFLIQIFQPQRQIKTILPEKISNTLVGATFREQNIDFAVEFPYSISKSGRKGFCIEIDGSQHEETQQKLLDRRRDDAVLESDWANTIRLKTKEFNEQGLHAHFNYLNKGFNQQYFKTLHVNYKLPLFQHKEGRKALELSLVPFAVARIELVLINAVISGLLSFDEEVWKIAILERDVPCARLAIHDLKRFFNAFSNLENTGRKFPQIDLDVFYSNEFKDSPLRHESDKLIKQIPEVNQHYDVYIDISILERIGLSKRSEQVNFDIYFQIRSSYHPPLSNPCFLTGRRIIWGELVSQKQVEEWDEIPETSKALEFFIQNIFRKKSFREGQLRILNRALKNQTVIGLLPTGGGKSLTYQLAGILQPGHVIVIDPIKSLMKDQVDGLARIGITGTVFINSSLRSFEEREAAQNKLCNGEALFCFISPERMMIDRFRQSLGKMATKDHYFSYGVIDEVHCVSEWGHNFRTPYLSLGKNLLDFCRAEDGEIALFGLTATASFDVLSDVQRELSGNSESQQIPDEAIVRHENTNRNELQYYIERVEIPEDVILDLSKRANGPYLSFKINETIGIMKQERINKILSDPSYIIHKFNINPNQVINADLIALTNSGKSNVLEIHKSISLPQESYIGGFWKNETVDNQHNAALVFAPHKTWFSGVTDIYRTDGRSLGIADSIKRMNIVPADLIGTFMGVDSDDEATAAKLQHDNDYNQEAFIEGRQKIMVATKAFGMGIDKSNIRLTIHNNYPDSIESFVQEAGRGGRDRKLSVACILYNDQKVYDQTKDKVIEHDLELQEQFFWNSFKGEEHEKRILFELLTEIEFPSKNRERQLSRILNEHPDIMDLGITLRVKHFIPRNRIYINGPDKTEYGYIAYLSGNFVYHKSDVNKEISEKSLSILGDLIRELALDITPQFLQQWLSESGDFYTQPGIEKILDTLEYGDEFEIVVSFANDHQKVYEKIAKLILHFLEKPLSDAEIKMMQANCRKAYNVKLVDFLENLDKKVPILSFLQVKSHESPDIAEKFKRDVQTNLNKRRNKEDTEKAIYRFSVIGVIDDYTVDYNSETYRLKGRKKRPEEYHQSLRFHISKYYSKKRTESVIKGLTGRAGNTEIQRILNFITDFVYQEIAKKRYERIAFMKECCLIGLNQGNIEMKTWIHLYFNSKYARKGYSVNLEEETLKRFRYLPLRIQEEGEYNASLLDWTADGKEENFLWVFDFMNLMEFDSKNVERDNLKHLRGACSRLLIVNPENYVIRLLRAYSVILLEEDNLKDSTKEQIIEDLKRGYFNLFDREILDFNFDDGLEEYANLLVEKLNNYKAIAWFQSVMEDLVFLAHTRWTQNFTERFTKDMSL